MCTRCFFVGGLTALMTAPALASERRGAPQALEIAMPGMRRIADNAWLGQLTTNVWIHTTTHVIDGVGFYPANGAIVVNGREALLIDTGWNDRDAATILDAWNNLQKPKITKALVTHFHNDRLGGIGMLSKRGIPSFGNPITIGLAIDSGYLPPRPLHNVERHQQVINGVEVFYPGAGHTIDNIVAWIPGDNVLFGGCLVKATTARDLGNVADGNLETYASTMRRLMHTYSSPKHVIPGHGTIAGNSLLHTKTMALATLPP
jgi:metallo-beta-lactamase class B